MAVTASREHGLGPHVRRLLEESRPQPQSLIGDLIATYWAERGDLIPSGALVELLHDFGLSAASSRTALSRLARKGRIVRTQVGRRTFYRHTAAGAQRVGEVGAHVASFGATPGDWDGRWWVVAFNVPEEERAQRHVLRSQLRELGFRPLYDGVWINPRGSADALREALAQTGVDRATVFEAEAHTAVEIDSIFGLDEIARRYRSYLDDLSVFTEAGDSVTLAPADALVLRTIVWDRWREVVQTDPDVPAPLLPRDWPRPAAHDLFVQLHFALEPLARERVQAAEMLS